MKLHIPNIPAVPIDEIDEPTWKWLHSNFPAEYKQAQKEIKEYEADHPAEAQKEEAKAEDKGAPAKSGVAKGG